MAKSKKSQKATKEDGMNDWIANLAKQQTAGDSQQLRTAKSKEERIQKRAQKKARREQRQEERRRPEIPTKKEVTYKKAQNYDASKRQLKRLGQVLMALCREHQEQHSRPYLPTKGEELVKRTKALNETTIQPRPSDYSGIGLARESLFIPFSDPSHIPKLEEEFKEHIPGFFGKQRTKAMKKQLDGNMLWRKLADQKQKGGGAIPKKFANLPPDLRVQAMIDAGMI